MEKWQSWLWDGLGWSTFGPLGSVLGSAAGTLAEDEREDWFDEEANYPQTRAGDFGVALLVLLPSVMEADGKVEPSELEFVHDFFTSSVGEKHAAALMVALDHIRKQDYDLKSVCHQVQVLMDYPSRLELVYLLFGLAQADAHMAAEEMQAIEKISDGIEISPADIASLRAILSSDEAAPYTVLQVEPDADEVAVEQAYRNMRDAFNPEKVAHLGVEFHLQAGEKFKALAQAYKRIREKRGWD